MKSKALFASAAALLLASACTQYPPQAFMTPGFEEISINDAEPGAIVFTCKMTSMSQLVQYGLDYTCDPDADDAGWIRVDGVKTGGNSFQVTVHGLAPGATYCYRMFISNGRDVLQSSQNYYTTPE